MRLAQAAAAVLMRGGAPGKVVMGKDTRLSGYMLETAMIAGFTSVGMDVIQAGPIPTPAVAMLTKRMGASLGVMISASHNPYYDNGIKFFGSDGFKLTDAEEVAISTRLRKKPELADPERIGGVQRLNDGQSQYLSSVRRTLPRKLSLSGLKIVVDAAHGAAYRCAPRLLAALGAEVMEMGCSPDGININAACGSTDTTSCRQMVIAQGADMGIALDGDADRVIMIDETGTVVDGDQLLALIAERMLRTATLRSQSVVATVMSNIGLERYLAAHGVGLARSKVGDRHVIEAMRKIGCNLGGEQSGHIILSDHSTTGDGLLAAVQVLAEIVEAGRPASQVLRRFEPLPQIHRSIRLEAGALSLRGGAVEAIVADARSSLGPLGRLVVRASGTEPVLRVMLEGESLTELVRLSDALCDALEGALATGWGTDWKDGYLTDELPEPVNPDPFWAIGGPRDDAVRSASSSALN